MANKKEQSVDSILAAAGAKMSVKAAPTGSSVPPVDNGQQFDFDQPPITGPIDFGKMKPVTVKEDNVVGLISKTQAGLITINDDAKYGKAFQIALKTVTKFKVDSVKDFCLLVQEIKENL